MKQVYIEILHADTGAEHWDLLFDIHYYAIGLDDDHVRGDSMWCSFRIYEEDALLLRLKYADFDKLAKVYE